jgi:YD repeat-containing protein
MGCRDGSEVEARHLTQRQLGNEHRQRGRTRSAQTGERAPRLENDMKALAILMAALSVSACLSDHRAACLDIGVRTGPHNTCVCPDGYRTVDERMCLPGDALANPPSESDASPQVDSEMLDGGREQAQSNDAGLDASPLADAGDDGGLPDAEIFVAREPADAGQDADVNDGGPQCVIATEVCDGRDNDCDGMTDEGVKNACGQCGAVPSEVCDGADNDCDGMTDEGVKNACGRCGAVPAESCSTAGDDNCDGRVNEGCPPQCVPTTQLCHGVGNDEDCVLADDSVYAYDGSGQLVSKTYPGGSRWRYSYDSAGNLVQKIEPNGSIWLFQWSGAMLMTLLTPTGQTVSCP